MNSEIKKFKGHIIAATAIGVFAGLSLMFSTALSPAKPSKQHIFCIKFKETVAPIVIDQQIKEFKLLKSEIKGITELSAGKTTDQSKDFDYVFRLTFKNAEEVETFKTHIKYQEFVKTHGADWAHQLQIDADLK